jgi:hypothetical protein
MPFGWQSRCHDGRAWDSLGNDQPGPTCEQSFPQISANFLRETMLQKAALFQHFA